jgi:hypothetical protein
MTSGHSVMRFVVWRSTIVLQLFIVTTDKLSL